MFRKLDLIRLFLSFLLVLFLGFGIYFVFRSHKNSSSFFTTATSSAGFHEAISLGRSPPMLSGWCRDSNLVTEVEPLNLPVVIEFNQATPIERTDLEYTSVPRFTTIEEGLTFIHEYWNDGTSIFGDTTYINLNVELKQNLFSNYLKLNDVERNLMTETEPEFDSGCEQQNLNVIYLFSATGFHFPFLNLSSHAFWPSTQVQNGRFVPLLSVNNFSPNGKITVSEASITYAECVGCIGGVSVSEGKYYPGFSFKSKTLEALQAIANWMVRLSKKPESEDDSVLLSLLHSNLLNAIKTEIESLVLSDTLPHFRDNLQDYKSLWNDFSTYSNVDSFQPLFGSIIRLPAELSAADTLALFSANGELDVWKDEENNIMRNKPINDESEWTLSRLTTLLNWIKEHAYHEDHSFDVETNTAFASLKTLISEIWDSSSFTDIRSSLVSLLSELKKSFVFELDPKPTYFYVNQDRIPSFFGEIFDLAEIFDLSGLIQESYLNTFLDDSNSATQQQSILNLLVFGDQLFHINLEITWLKYRDKIIEIWNTNAKYQEKRKLIADYLHRHKTNSFSREDSTMNEYPNSFNFPNELSDFSPENLNLWLSNTFSLDGTLVSTAFLTDPPLETSFDTLTKLVRWVKWMIKLDVSTHASLLIFSSNPIIIGSVVGGFATCMISFWLIFYFWKWRKKKNFSQ